MCSTAVYFFCFTAHRGTEGIKLVTNFVPFLPFYRAFLPYSQNVYSYKILFQIFSSIYKNIRRYNEIASHIHKNMPFKPGPKKKISREKVYEDLSGAHVVSSDGSIVNIGGATFRRTILPSGFAPKQEIAKLNSDLEDLDEQPLKEEGIEEL